MRAFIAKSKIAGRARVPSSKSYTIRALMCAALAQGESQIKHPLISNDTEAARDVLSKIGVGITVAGDTWRVNGGRFHQSADDLFCGESAATLRFMTAICSLVPGKCQLTMAPSLAKRPLLPLLQALRQLGVNCSLRHDVNAVTVVGGKLKGGAVSLPGNISSQFVSALLLISPLAENGMTITLTTPLESRPYVLMTLDCQQQFRVTVGFSEELDRFEALKQAYQPTEYEVEGDWSSASYLLALGAVCGGVEVTNLDPESRQGDKIILDFLRQMGARIELGENSVRVEKARLRAIKADLTDCIDLLPTMAVLAAIADGESEFTGIERARIKESNRVAAVKEGLEKMGIKVEEERNKLTVTGSVPRGAVIDAGNDHRIAMAFSILGAVTGDTVIEGAECVSKTFPQFWSVLQSIGGKVELDGE
ncbi:MAG: 3-phosphoshikimate 1-carboxyvinyltransferase [Dehalococcoidales bacterium]|nr:3-phosphoshikimate 1-carboxyvinyltransferase [Dehalococcoidales bacterium]